MPNDTSAHIIENARPPEGSRLGWRIGPEPTVSIGVVDGEDPYVFGSVPDAMRLSDGRIVVVESGSAELRVFDGGSGTHLATWAGRGEGPGEVSELGHVAPLPGDSIIAWSYLRSVTVFDPDGNFVRTSHMKRLAETSAGPRPPTPVAVLDDGSLLAIFDPDGHVLGFVETPEGLEIYEIGADYILGRVGDELGVQSIQLWSLERTEGQAS